MRIDLTSPLPSGFTAPDGFTAVGLVDDGVLAYDPERRPVKLTWGRNDTLDPIDVNRALLDAVHEAGLAIWPGGHRHAMPQALGLNVRSLSPDRIVRSGLAPRVLEFLNRIASSPDVRSLGIALSTISSIDHHRMETGAGPKEIIAEALDVYLSVRAGRTVRAPNINAIPEPAEDDPTPASPLRRIDGLLTKDACSESVSHAVRPSLQRGGRDEHLGTNFKGP